MGFLSHLGRLPKLAGVESAGSDLGRPFWLEGFAETSTIQGQHSWGGDPADPECPPQGDSPGCCLDAVLVPCSFFHIVFVSEVALKTAVFLHQSI